MFLMLLLLVDLLDKKYDNQKITITGENKFRIEEIIKIISEILNKNKSKIFK